MNSIHLAYMADVQALVPRFKTFKTPLPFPFLLVSVAFCNYFGWILDTLFWYCVQHDYAVGAADKLLAFTTYNVLWIKPCVSHLRFGPPFDMRLLKYRTCTLQAVVLTKIE